MTRYKKKYSTETHKHPLHLHYTHPWSSWLHHTNTEDESMLYILSYLMTQCAIMLRLSDCILILRLPPAERQATAKTITATAAKLLYVWLGGDGGWRNGWNNKIVREISEVKDNGRGSKRVLMGHKWFCSKLFNLLLFPFSLNLCSSLCGMIHRAASLFFFLAPSSLVSTSGDVFFLV